MSQTSKDSLVRIGETIFYASIVFIMAIGASQWTNNSIWLSLQYPLTIIVTALKISGVLPTTLQTIPPVTTVITPTTETVTTNG